MLDLIFVLKSKETRKNGYITVETLLCNNKYNKNFKYRGGLLTRTDIYSVKHVTNINDMEFSIIKKYLYKNTAEIYKYGLIMTLDSFLWLCKNTLKYENLYFADNSDSMTLILGICDWQKGNNGKNINAVDIDDCLIGFSNKTKQICFSRKSTVSSRLILDLKPNIQMVYNEDMPCTFELRFDYIKQIISFNSNVKVINTGNDLIARNYMFENQTFNYLINIGFKKISSNKLKYVGKSDIKDIIAILKQKGYKVLKAEHTKDNSLKLPEIIITPAGTDWFDINLNYRFNDKIYDLASEIDLSSDKKSLTINDTYIKIPDSIIENKNKLVIKDGKLRIDKRYLWSVLHIASESKNGNISFINYSRIKIFLDKKLKTTAKPYQLQGIKWLKWLFVNKIGGCLADDMGLGKTFQIIAALSEKEIYSCLKHVLIIVPKTLLINWKREFEKFTDKFTICVYHGNNRAKIKLSDYMIIITTYHTAVNDIDILNNIDFTTIIYDEIQNLKNDNSLMSNRLKNLKAEVIFGLSGTPMENRIEELWNIMDIINPGMMNSKTNFCKRYKDNSHFNELHKLLTPFILRRTKSEVLSELPDRTEEIVYCDFDDDQRELYESIVLAIKNALSKNVTFDNSIMLKGLLLLRQCCCHTALLSEKVNKKHITKSSKLENLKLIVYNLYENGHKILIFSQFTSMLTIIKNHINIPMNDIFYLDGKTTNRQELVDSFERSKRGIFLISLKAGGVGLNLTSAQDVIIFDPWWNPFTEQQAIDRAYRIGQKNKVTVYKFIATNTIEDKILQLQENKSNNFNMIVNGISNNKNIDLMELFKLL